MRSPNPAGLRVLIYRDRLLPPSETFIRAQGEHLGRYVPHYMGAGRVDGLELPEDRVILVNQGGVRGRLAELMMKGTGVAPQVSRKLRDLRPSLLHAHFGVDGALVLPFARRSALPLVVTFHGYDITTSDAAARSISRAHRLYLSRRDALRHQATLFIAVSEFIKRRMLDVGFPGDRTVVHYTGVDTNYFTPDAGVPRDPVVLFVGRLVEKKGAAYLLEAMREVQARIPGCRVVLIGGGPLETRLKDLASRSSVQADFLGVQPPHVIRDWMNRAQVFCVPSVTATDGDAEGFGMVFAEAQAMGIPVVSTTNGGIPEAVQGGRTGLLCAERNPTQIAAAICRLLADRQLWEEMSDRAQRFVRAQLSIATQCRKLEDLYDEVAHMTTRRLKCRRPVGSYE